jgi:DNA-binding transcriptional regulator GbsR (MarR family)
MFAMLSPVKRHPVNQCTAGKTRLNAVEVEIVQLFAQFSYALGQRRSVGEIYGLLFISPLPLTLNDLKERLELSNGSTSQGLTFLRNLGAVRTVTLPDQRRTHYAAVAELRKLAGSFLRQQIAAQFSDGGSRLARATQEAQALTGASREHALARLKLLQSWEKNGRRVLPFLLQMLGGK